VAEQERFNFNNLPSRPRREREVVLYSFSSNHSTPPSLQGSETCKLSFLSTAVTLEATVLSVDYFSTMPRRLGQRDCPMKVRIMIADMRGVHSIPEIARAVGLSVSIFFHRAIIYIVIFITRKVYTLLLFRLTENSGGTLDKEDRAIWRREFEICAKEESDDGSRRCCYFDKN
jgi:hypothetical protein